MAQTVSLDKTSGNTVSLPQISAKEENKSEIFFLKKKISMNRFFNLDKHPCDIYLFLIRSFSIY